MSYSTQSYTLQVGIHILIFFLANLAKGNMSFCHHLVSIVCHPFTFHILIFSFRFIWPSGFRGEDFQNSANQKQELPVAAMFGNGS
jgi:hypothetical protein